MRKFSFLFLVAGLLLFVGKSQACEGGCGADGKCLAAPAAQVSDADVKKAVEAVDPSIKATAVAPTGDAGIYEVTYNDFNIVYYAPETGHIFFGMGTGKDNLTLKKMSALKADFVTDLKNLPLDGAVKIGKGARVVVEFSDAQCPYCRRAEPYFVGKEKDVTRYVFMIPLQGHDLSPALTKYVLCSKDRVAAYKEVMEGKLDGKTPELAASCAEKAEKQMADNSALSQKLGLRGTPMSFVDGVLVDGFNTDRLDALLGGNKAEQKLSSKGK
jgi:thiol:disulfide interchange protein DsbC